MNRHTFAFATAPDGADLVVVYAGADAEAAIAALDVLLDDPQSPQTKGSVFRHVGKGVVYRRDVTPDAPREPVLAPQQIEAHQAQLRSIAEIEAAAQRLAALDPAQLALLGLARAGEFKDPTTGERSANPAEDAPPDFAGATDETLDPVETTENSAENEIDEEDETLD